MNENNDNYTINLYLYMTEKIGPIHGVGGYGYILEQAVEKKKRNDCNIEIIDGELKPSNELGFNVVNNVYYCNTIKSDILNSCLYIDVLKDFIVNFFSNFDKEGNVSLKVTTNFNIAKKDTDLVLRQYEEFKKEFRVSHIQTNIVSNGTDNTMSGVVKELIIITRNSVKNGSPLNKLFIGKMNKDKEDYYQRIIEATKIYFNSSIRANSRGFYYAATTGSVNELFLGKKMADSTFYLINVNEPNKLIEEIFDLQSKICGEYNSIYKLDLKILFSNKFVNYYEVFGLENILYIKKGNMFFVDRQAVTSELNPLGLFPVVLNGINLLETILLNYIEYKKNNEANFIGLRALTYEDITDKYNDVNEKGKLSLKKTIINDVGIPIVKTVTKNDNIKQITMNIFNTQDTMSRNRLKKIEKDNPKIILVTWKPSENSIKYATIVDTDEGVGLWSNYFASTVVY